MTSEPESAETTIRSWADRLRAVGLSFFVVFGGMWLLIDALDEPGWAKHALVPTVAAYLAAAWLVVTWRIAACGRASTPSASRSALSSGPPGLAGPG
jgi:hypothetical protein